MFNINRFKNKEKNPNLASQALLNRASKLRKELITVKPAILAHHTEAEFIESSKNERHFVLSLFNEEIRLKYPSFIVYNEITSSFLFFFRH